MRVPNFRMKTKWGNYMYIWKCSKCGKSADASNNYCPKCGTSLINERDLPDAKWPTLVWRRK